MNREALEYFSDDDVTFKFCHFLIFFRRLERKTKMVSDENSRAILWLLDFGSIELTTKHCP